MQVSNTVVVCLVILCIIMYIRDMGTATAAAGGKKSSATATVNDEGVDGSSSGNNNNNNNYNKVNSATYSNVDAEGMIDESKNTLSQYAYLESLRKNRRLRQLNVDDIINSPEKRVHVLFCTS
jgi:hypothetical protein